MIANNSYTGICRTKKPCIAWNTLELVLNSDIMN